METSIPIFKYGEETEFDDETLFGCLMIDKIIEQNYYGTIEPDVLIERTTLETSYLLRSYSDGTN